MKLANPPGAQFEILVDGKPRSYRDIKAVAIASAEFLREQKPAQRSCGEGFAKRGSYRRDQGLGPLMPLKEIPARLCPE